VGNCVNPATSIPTGLPAQPSPTIPASTAGTPTAGQAGCITGTYDINGNCITSTTPGTTSWLSDPGQDIITGIPNWALLAAAAGAVFLISRGGRR
jgi:hypothetical protein